MSKKLLPDDKTLAEMYNSGKNMKQICRECGLSPSSSGNISLRLRKMGIEIRKDAGQYHHAWKGGRILKGDGYIGVWNPKHEGADKQGYVYEHTLIIEQKIGRLPEKGEVIHHINLDKLDNSIDNLWLCGNKEHLVCHRSIEKLIKPLLEKGIIMFENGEYKIKDNC